LYGAVTVFTFCQNAGTLPRGQLWVCQPKMKPVTGYRGLDVYTESQCTPRRLLRVLISLLSLALLSTLAYGQGTASIVGIVTDPGGLAVPNAKITITNTETGFVRPTITNVTGSYAARELAIGRYNVRVEVVGFKSYERTGITLNVNDTVRVDAPLQVGEASQSVTIEATAAQVQADSNEVSQTITAAMVSDLATNGRNVIQLATLVPGASASIPDFDTPMAQTQNRSISFNGQRPDHNNWMRRWRHSYRFPVPGCAPGIQGHDQQLWG
jgi:hypothetical protein